MSNKSWSAFYLSESESEFVWYEELDLNSIEKKNGDEFLTQTGASTELRDYHKRGSYQSTNRTSKN